MPYRKGELSPKRRLLEWPHHVVVVIPELGLGTRLTEMIAFAASMDHQRVSRAGRGKPDTTVWCFKRKEDADAFAERFGSDRG